MQLLLSREPRILLVRYDQALTIKTLGQLDRVLTKFVQREGTMDTIFDFSSAPRTDVPTSVMVKRGQTLSHMPDRQRIFVAPDDVYFGMFRLYGAYQSYRGAKAPDVVKSLEEALVLLGGQNAVFAPY